MSSTITLTSLGGFSGSVNVSASVYPSGPSVSLTSGVSSQSVILDLPAGGSASTPLFATSYVSGNFTITITGVSGPLSHSVPVIFEAQPLPADFSIDCCFSLGNGNMGRVAAGEKLHFLGLGDEHQPFLRQGKPDRNPQPQCESLHQAIHAHCSRGWNGRADYHVPSTCQRDAWPLHWHSNSHQWLDNSYGSLDTHCGPATARLPYMLSECLVIHYNPLSCSRIILTRNRDRLSESQQQPQVHPDSRERRPCFKPRIHRSHSHTCHRSHLGMARLARTYLYSILGIRVSIHLARNP